MCVWNVSAKDRMCIYCSYFGGCERRSMKAPEPVMDVFDNYVSIMSDIVGGNILSSTRLRDIVWPRHMVAYKMKSYGYSYTQIGECFGKNHATVINGVHRVRDMLEYPKAYEHEMKIWNEFNIKTELCGKKL